jgi:hypothetical protein
MTTTDHQTEPAADETTPEKEKMVIIAASGDLDKAWPVLILATTGAAYGMDVTVFFTFWGISPEARIVQTPLRRDGPGDDARTRR